MGLDMYFTARRYLWSYPEDGPDAKKAAKLREFFPELPDHAEFKNVEVEFGYWRKANAIHKWFVDNVQGGEDECKDTYVGREDIAKLLNAVETVLADKSRAEELLPTQSGFFFGDTSYDEYYFRNLDDTREIMRAALDDKMKKWDFYYHSSW